MLAINTTGIIACNDYYFGNIFVDEYYFSSVVSNEYHYGNIAMKSYLAGTNKYYFGISGSGLVTYLLYNYT